MATKKNPTFVKGRIKSVPKGKRKGEIFTHKGNPYIVISYVTSTGKRVRYGQRVSKTPCRGKRGPGKKRACPTRRKAKKTRKRRKKRKAKRRRNPILLAGINPYAGGMCDLPRSQSSWRSGYRHRSGGRGCVVQRARSGGYLSYAHSGLSKKRKASKGAVAIPKGKRKGDHFTRKGRRYVVVSFTNNNGKRVRYARKA